MSWIWPTTGTPSISGYDWLDPVNYISALGTYQHPGIDIAGGLGDSLLAPTGGTVSFAGWSDAGYGNLIILNTEDGHTVYLAHLKEMLVNEGDTVSPGEEIGYIGSTGNSTGAHLHLEIRNGMPLNPWDFFGSDPLPGEVSGYGSSPAWSGNGKTSQGSSSIKSSGDNTSFTISTPEGQIMARTFKITFPKVLGGKTIEFTVNFGSIASVSLGLIIIVAAIVAVIWSQKEQIVNVAENTVKSAAGGK